MSKKDNNYYNIIYGQHACFSVLNNESRQIFEILITDKKVLSDKLLKKYEKNIRIVDKKYIEKTAQIEDKHQGIVLKAGDLIEKISLYDLIKNIPENKFHYGFILDRVQDPHNIGAIIRSAYCFGASFIIMGKHEAPIINNTIIRTSAGFSEILPIYTVTNLVREIKSIKDLGFWVMGLDNNKTSELPREIISKYGNKIAFVLGSEGEGMKELTKTECDAFIKIPMIPNAESLNVSNTCAVIGYEAHILINKF